MNSSAALHNASVSLLKARSTARLRARNAAPAAICQRIGPSAASRVRFAGLHYVPPALDPAPGHFGPVTPWHPLRLPTRNSIEAFLSILHQSRRRLHGFDLSYVTASAEMIIRIVRKRPYPRALRLAAWNRPLMASRKPLVCREVTQARMPSR